MYYFRISLKNSQPFHLLKSGTYRYSRSGQGTDDVWVLKQQFINKKKKRKAMYYFSVTFWQDMQYIDAK